MWQILYPSMNRVKLECYLVRKLLFVWQPNMQDFLCRNLHFPFLVLFKVDSLDKFSNFFQVFNFLFKFLNFWTRLSSAKINIYLIAFATSLIPSLTGG